MSETFTCAACGKIYEKERSDAEAMAESKELWRDIPEDELAVICDDCHNRGIDAALAEHAELGYPKTTAEAERRRKARAD